MRALRGVIVLVLALALSVPVLAADFQAGGDAYNRGDYATALNPIDPVGQLSKAIIMSSAAAMRAAASASAINIPLCAATASMNA